MKHRPEEVIVVCRPTARLATPSGPASKTYCEQCHTEVWLADTTPRCPGMHLLCEDCGIIEIASDDEAVIVSFSECVVIIEEEKNADT